MVNFGKRLKKQQDKAKVNPIHIYEDLDRKSSAGPLRLSQESILKEWFENRQDKKNVLLKLHTGEGKTLIGLLALQSKLNSKDGPCLYLCPNKHLASQVCAEAEKFGINYVVINNRELPESFLSGSKILITHVQNLFHGRTIFGLNNHSQKIGSLVLDDSHACVDSIRSSMTIKIPKANPIYSSILSLFESSIIEQGHGSFLEIKDGEYGTLLPIPYWAWFDKVDSVTQIFTKNRDSKEVKYAWPLMKDKMELCHAFISGSFLEIVPFDFSVDSFGSFNNADHRILMSATTQDDAFMIKGLGFHPSDISDPLTNKEQRWSGEKFILLPFLMDDSISRNIVINEFAKSVNGRDYGVVFITPSFKSKGLYEKVGAKIANSSNIDELSIGLTNGSRDDAVVFVNRYDGIDLPDDACRVLILDSKPYLNSLFDSYQEDCRPNCDLINMRIAQRIEQGLGRSVRGEKDYSVIILTGSELTKFVRNRSTGEHFSNQTKMQIEIGKKVAEYAVEDGENEGVQSIWKLIDQVISRDDSWKEYYRNSMNNVTADHVDVHLHKSLQLEYKAERLFQDGKIQDACDTMQYLADSNQDDSSEKAWYLQQKARFMYKLSIDESNSLQRTAFKLNRQLLKPINGVVYTKLNYINQTRAVRVQDWVKQFDDFQHLKIELRDIADGFEFHSGSERFEHAVERLGTALGFVSERPDKIIKKGPDNLWCCGKGKYILIECKSEVSETRVEISKTEAGQMNSHCGWFDSEYKDVICRNILIIHTKKLSYHGDFTHDVQVMRKNRINLLKKRVESFFEEFHKYELSSIQAEQIQKWLNLHSLSVDSLMSEYSEPYIKQSKT